MRRRSPADAGAHADAAAHARLLLLLLGLLAARAQAAEAPAAPQLRFVDGAFKVVFFCDLHFGDDAARDNRSIEAMRAVLAAEPDAQLAVLCGDTVSGGGDDGSAGWWERQFGRPAGVLEEAGVPYAAVLGNHVRARERPPPAQPAQPALAAAAAYSRPEPA